MQGKRRFQMPGKRKVKRKQLVIKAIRNYCRNSSVHGLRYVLDPELHWLIRLIWFLIVALFAYVASNVIYNLSCRFQEAPTSIEIASTNYEISAVPFPSVTLCPNDRVDWKKTLDLEKRLFDASTEPATISTFRDIMQQLSMMTFGDFDDLTFLKERKLDGLLELKPTEILREVLPDCEDLFSNCWWRNANRNCCEIFEVQRTEYGFCYSFNSDLAEVSEVGSGSRDQTQEERPRRASGYGDWSGVKVTIHLGNLTAPPDSEEIRGVVLMVSEPRVWPNSGNMIPEGSLVNVAIDCVSGFATKPVLELDEKRAPCRHVDSGIYNQETCLSLCKRAHVVKYCECNPSFFFPSGSIRDCSVRDFLCLIDHNDVFNDYYVLKRYEAIEQRAMICGCPPECEYYIYNPQFSTVPLKGSQDIMLDVHFVGQTSFRYKTDIVITDMDLLVSFGGIMGLFLGGSLLSAAELIYYVILALFYCLRSCLRRSLRLFGRYRPASFSQKERTRRKHGSSTLMRAAVIHSSGIPVAPLPILDYSPVKPRSSRIPIFFKYSPMNSDNYQRY